jgi:preprotein translocase subunit SecE
MAKTAVVSAQAGVVERIKGIPDSIRAFYSDVRNEMRKVTFPGRNEVQDTTVVVIITVFLFGLFFWIVDGVVGHGLDSIYKYFSTH